MDKIAIVSHDAGGAELVSSWAANSGSDSFMYCVSGPAKKIFSANLGWNKSSTIDEIVDQCDSLICGTSWQSDLEHTAIKAFKSCGKKTIAIVDHWTNYKERFSFNGNHSLPDEIWVADEYAMRIAKECFDNVLIRLIENSYLINIKKEIMSLESAEDRTCVALYVCEPIREHALKQHGDARYWGYTEEDALEYFLANIEVIPQEIKKILIRPHPSELPDKYNWITNRFSQDIEFSYARTLAEDIASASVVVGCESMAMVAALYSKKFVISSIPPGGRKCVLPHTDIMSLKNLAQKSKSVE